MSSYVLRCLVGWEWRRLSTCDSGISVTLAYINWLDVAFDIRVVCSTVEMPPFLIWVEQVEVRKAKLCGIFEPQSPSATLGNRNDVLFGRVGSSNNTAGFWFFRHNFSLPIRGSDSTEGERGRSKPLGGRQVFPLEFCNNVVRKRRQWSKRFACGDVYQPRSG